VPQGFAQKGEDGYHHAREWHPACKKEFLTISYASSARWYVYDRDKGVCAKCGENTNLTKYDEPRPKREEFSEYKDYSEAYQVWLKLIYAAAWHLDHIKPLWSSAGLPDDERLPFFQLTNMQTLCPPCHAVKTKREAAERAEIKNSKVS